MAGHWYLHLLILFNIGFLSAPGLGQAQTPQPAATQQTFTQNPPGRRPGLTGESPNAPEFENARRAIESLTPEQRKRFQENILRWMNLTKEEKELLREREEWRREVMAQEVERALKQSGLIILDPARRDLFAKRYAEERRALETQLRKDMEEKRRPLVQALIGRLRQEFSTNPPSTPSPAPSP
jgi:hypothetical protein